MNDLQTLESIHDKLDEEHSLGGGSEHLSNALIHLRHVMHYLGRHETNKPKSVPPKDAGPADSTGEAEATK